MNTVMSSFVEKDMKETPSRHWVLPTRGPLSMSSQDIIIGRDERL